MDIKNINLSDNKSEHLDVRSSPEIKEPVLEGKALQIYWYLITNGVKGIRDIQKDLNFPSSSTVHYHVKKLIEKKIVIKYENTDKYTINEELKTGILSLYFRVGFKMIPRLTFYLIIHTIGLFMFLLLILFSGIEKLLDPIIFISFCYFIFGTLVFIFESKNIQKIRPN